MFFRVYGTSGPATCSLFAQRKTMNHTTLRSLTCAALITGLFASFALAQNPLPSWNEGPAKSAITDFVAKVTKEGSSDFILAEERIAVFDNDGTLWCEQPMYFQLAFAIDEIQKLAPEHPEWQTKEPFKSVLAGDLKGALAGGEKAILAMIAATHTGMTTDEFDQLVRDWLRTAHHPRFQQPYNMCVYQPMVEVLEYLRANGFKTFIVSGGGVEFMRVWAEQAYGIPPEQVVGSSGKLKYELREGKPVIVKLPEVDFIDDKAGKPVGIEKFIGRRPIIAFGNSDGDFEMLEYTSTDPSGPRLGLFVHHTDAKREYAYDRDSHIGQLNRGLDEAPKRGWVLIDMKKDWKKVFAFQQ
jgi:phosphoglycolate phosphatase-like HAD superfamily hydrolase